MFGTSELANGAVWETPLVDIGLLGTDTESDGANRQTGALERSDCVLGEVGGCTSDELVIVECAGVLDAVSCVGRVLCAESLNVWSFVGAILGTGTVPEDVGANVVVLVGVLGVSSRGPDREAPVVRVGGGNRMNKALDVGVLCEC